jgi:FkbM family methyltransferase
MTNRLLSLATWVAQLAPTSLKRAFYRSPALAGIIRRSLNKAAPHGLLEIKIAAGGLAGKRMILDLQKEKDYWLGTYELQLQSAIADLVKPGMVVYDVGANIGYITLLLTEAVGEIGRVVAFEALPENLDRLRDNLSMNDVDSRVQVEPSAVTGQPGPVQFLVGPSGGTGKIEGSTGRENISYSGSITVPGVSLDDYVFEKNGPLPDVVKMDIEGGETTALPGMCRILTQLRPLVFLELHGHEAAEVAWDVLSGANYCVCSMTDDYPEIYRLTDLDWKSYIVAIPNS